MKTYKEIAEKILPEHKRKPYVMYMTLRWGADEKMQCLTGYANEWAERFLYDAEYTASDQQGQSILREMGYSSICKKYNLNKNSEWCLSCEDRLRCLTTGKPAELHSELWRTSNEDL